MQVCFSSSLISRCFWLLFQILTTLNIESSFVTVWKYSQRDSFTSWENCENHVGFTALQNQLWNGWGLQRLLVTVHIVNTHRGLLPLFGLLLGKMWESCWFYSFAKPALKCLWFTKTSCANVHRKYPQRDSFLSLCIL